MRSHYKTIVLSVLMFVIAASHSLLAQTLKSIDRGSPSFKNNRTLANDSIGNQLIDVVIKGEKTYKDYKIFNIKNDTTLVDTTLTIKKHFKMNFLRKDLFELLPFPNQGQSFTLLSASHEKEELFPTMGITAKRFNFYNPTSIQYFHLPTPTTEIMYRSGFEKGQVLDVFFTANPSSQMNISFSYEGLRSLGKYMHSLSSHKNFRSSLNYLSKNNRYQIKAHMVSFSLLNEENGGLTEEAVENFISDHSDYDERTRLTTRFTDANSVFEGKRYFFQQEYQLTHSRKKKDSLNDSKSLGGVRDGLNIPSKKLKISIGQQFLYQIHHYQFSQSNSNDFFGTSSSESIFDKTKFEKFKNELYVAANHTKLGSAKGYVNHFVYNYQLTGNQITSSDQPQKLKGTTAGFGGHWKLPINKKITGSVKGYLGFAGSSFVEKMIATKLSYQKDSLTEISLFGKKISSPSNFNTRLYQSNYENYNWNNAFKNEVTSSLGLKVQYKSGGISFTVNEVKNNVYFNTTQVPEQALEKLSYFKIKGNHTFTLGKFSLDNTVLYQKVTNGASILKLPSLVSRNVLYYSNYLFKKKPLYLQAGISFKYFTAFKANAYNPLTGEFYLQNDTKIGGYPIFDVFFNGQIKRTRLFLTLENVTSGFTGRKYFSAPNYPYRDFTVRFGIVWNFFI